MVGIVLVTHSAALAEAVKKLAETVGGNVPIATAGGIDDDEHPFGTDATRIKEAIDSVYSKEGVLVLMDVGSSIISAELALDFLPEQKRERVLLCEAPLVEGAITATVTSEGGGALSEVAREANRALSAKRDQLAGKPGSEKPVQPAEDDVKLRTVSPQKPQKTNIQPQETVPAGGERTVSIVLTVPNDLGFHARPASKLVAKASGFASRITVQNVTRNKGPVNARSINGLITLGVRGGHTIRITASGPDADGAITALKELVEGFVDGKLPDSLQTTGKKTLNGEIPPGEPYGLKKSGEVFDIKKGATIHCIGTSSGIAVGPSLRLRPVFETNGPRTPEDPETEWSKLKNALLMVKKRTLGMKKRILKETGEDDAAIFDAHISILEDPVLLTSVKQTLFTTSCTAEDAWKSAIDRVVAAYRADDSPYIRAREMDIQDISSQVLHELCGSEVVSKLDYPCIILAGRLLPSDIAGLDRKMILGVCTVYETPNSHAMILLRSLDIPAATLSGKKPGVGILKIPDKTPLVLDADRGVLVADPENIARYKRAQKKREVFIERLRRESSAPAVSADGKTVPVLANIGSVEEAGPARERGADGIGVLRTEFLFLQRENPPTEEEQADSYRAVADIFRGLPVIVRTLDAGGDKTLPFLTTLSVDNPALGKRGIRLALELRDILKTQFRAVLRACAGTTMKLMLPMVTTVQEVRTAHHILEAAKEELLTEGKRFHASTAMGIMIEVPAAALASVSLGPECDFFSVGTNDLSQYTMAADRTNPDVSSLNDALHPALLRLIEMTVIAGHEAGIQVSVCGEIAADPEATAVLLGLGIDTLSMNPVSIPRIKSEIRKITIADARHLARRALGCSSAEEVREITRSFLTHS